MHLASAVDERRQPGHGQSGHTTALRRVLLVSPHFPPVNGPDHQRVRMALPHLAVYGWQAEVLAVEPGFVETPLDHDLAAAVPSSVRIHRVPAASPRQTRRFGWGSLARRSYSFLRDRGSQLLATGRFDLVAFSTSQFGVLPLARDWQRRHGVPYVLDFHDEWVSDYYRRHPHIVPPGGRFKYALSHALARWQEGGVIRNAAQIVVVSDRYKANLLRRHRSLQADDVHVLPFGGAPEDFTAAAHAGATQDFFRPGEGRNWAYVGRGGPAMRLTVSAFFLAMKRALHKGMISEADFRLHCIGTDYAVGDAAQPTFLPLAAREGVAGQVREHTARVPYFTACRCLREADALVLFGSDDPGYAPSKLMPYIFARRPLLALLHRASGCVDVLRQTGAGLAVTFSDEDNAASFAERIYREWFVPRRFSWTPRIAPGSLLPHTSAEMTRRLGAIFAAAVCPRSA